MEGREGGRVGGKTPRGKGKKKQIGQSDTLCKELPGGGEGGEEEEGMR